MAVFWAPVALMWVLMSVEGPLIAAVIARMPHPAANLAAFQLTFALALLVESPVIMLLTAGTALATGPRRYRRLLEFTAIMALALTLVHLAIGLTGAYAWLIGGAVGAPADLVEPGRRAFLWMAAWSGAIAVRRLWQGVLIRHDRTMRVGATTAVRLVATGTVCAVGLRLGRLAGASVGGLALSIGVTTAAAAAYYLARPTIREHLAPGGGGSDPELSWGTLLSFYYPLALTSFIVLGGGPVVSFGLGRAQDARIALAVWPVVMGVLFVLRASGYAFQDVAVALLGRPGGPPALSRFAWALAGALTVATAFLALAPVGRLWMTVVAGLEAPLAAAALAPLPWLVPVPGLSVLVSWLRGRLVHVGATRAVTLAVAANLAALVVTMVAGLRYTHAPGAMVAGVATTASLILEVAALAAATRRAEAAFRPGS